MLRRAVRYAMACMIVYSCVIIMALTLDEFGQQEYKGSSNILEEIGKCCNLLAEYLQRVLAQLKSRSVVKFKCTNFGRENIVKVPL